MDTIFLNKLDLNKKAKYYSIDSTIYKFDNDTLFKYFKRNGVGDEKWKKYLTDKGQKINLLANIDMPENYFKAFVFLNGTLVGYTMENVFKEGYVPTNRLDYKTRDKKLELLELEKERILGFNDIGITYGNILEENFLYNPSTKRIIMLNIDNVKYKDKDFDFKDVYMLEYLKSNPKHPELLDRYMFNIHTIGYLQNVFYPSILNYLKEGKFCYELNTDINHKIANKMINLDETYNGKLFIDNQKPFIRKKTR